MSDSENPREVENILSIFLPQEVQTPSGLLDQERDMTGGRVKKVIDAHPNARMIDTLDKQVVYLSHQLPDDNTSGVKEFVGLSALESKRLMYFLHENREKRQGAELAPFAKRKVNTAMGVVGENRIFVDFDYFDKAIEIADDLETGIGEGGLRSLFQAESFGLSLSPAFLKIIKRACAITGRDLNGQMSLIAQRINEMFMTQGLELTEQNFKAVFLKSLEKAAKVRPTLVTRRKAVSNNFQQQKNIQQFVNSIPRANVFGSGAVEDAEMIEKILDDARERLSDLHDYMNVLGVRQMAYSQFKKSLDGQEFWLALSSVNTYLLQGYFMRYLKWLLGNEGGFDDIQL